MSADIGGFERNGGDVQRATLMSPDQLRATWVDRPGACVDSLLRALDCLLWGQTPIGGLGSGPQLAVWIRT